MPRRYIALLLLLLASPRLLAQANADEAAPVEKKKTEAPARSSNNNQPVPYAVQSAKQQAIEAAGIIRDSLTSDDIVAQALYVKLRVGRTGSDPVATVMVLARRAGLDPRAASRMGGEEGQLIADDFEQSDSKVADKVATDNASGRELPRAKGERKSPPATNQPKANRPGSGINIQRIVELYYGNNIPPQQAAVLMAQFPEVEYAELIRLPHLLGPPNDPMILESFQLPQVRALDAWEVWQGDTTMTIGIVDAGIDITHEDLLPNIQENKGETGVDALGADKRTNGIDDDGNGAIDDWHGANLTWQEDGTVPGNTKGSAHGTQVSGLASAATNNGIGIAGIGYKCRFFPVKAASNNGGLLTRAYEGLVYCSRRGFKVINCSWGSDGYSQALQDLVTDLVNTYDCAIVAGGGNSVAYSHHYPAGYAHVLGVGSVDSADAFVTTWGEQIGISSPGGFSTSDNGAYVPLAAATSYSTPIVSGALALVRSKWPDLSADQAIAHLRLTSDTVAQVDPGKRKLTGYGRLNVYRAVATEPFSHPGVVVDSVWLIDPAGNPLARAPVGTKGKIRMRVRNLLGGATHLRLRIYSYSSDSSAVRIDSSWVDVGTLGREEARILEDSIGFEVLAPNNDRIRVRFDFTADSNYTDYHYDRLLFFQPWITLYNDSVTASLGDHGRLGYEDLTNNLGDGIRFNETSMLYEGGFMIASDSTRVMNNVRNAIPDVQQEDFLPAAYPSVANNYTLTLTDSGAIGNRRIGLRVNVRMILESSISNAMAIELRTRYTGSRNVDTLRIAMYADWDLDNDPYGQKVDFETVPTDRAPYRGVITGGKQRHYLSHGIVLPITEQPIFYPIRNDSLPFEIYFGFDDAEKWRTLSNGIGATETHRSDTSDISLVIGKRWAGISPGTQQEDTTLWVIGFGSSRVEAVTAMEELARFLRGPTTGVDDRRSASSLLGSPHPNPFSKRTTVAIGPSHGATLRLYDSYGSLALDLTNRLPPEGFPSFLQIDATSLPDGLYFLRLTGPEGTASTPMIIINN
jgi:hypothetical protein